MWVDASAKTPTWQRRRSLRACLPDQAGGASEGGPARGRRRHAVAVEALAPPDAGSSRRDSCRDSRRNSVHECPNPAWRGPILPFVYTIAIPRPPTTQAHGPTVYTNTPKRPRGAISTDLCTLLRRRPGGEAHVAGVVTQPPTHTSSQSLYFRIRLRLCLEPSRFRHPTFPKQNRDLDHDSSFADFSPLSLRGEVSVCPSAYRLECSSYAQRA